MTRTEFRQTAYKVLTLAEVAAGFVQGRPAERIHAALELLSGAFHDDAKFTELCDAIGLPTDATPPAPPAPPPPAPPATPTT